MSRCIADLHRGRWCTPIMSLSSTAPRVKEPQSVSSNFLSLYLRLSHFFPWVYSVQCHKVGQVALFLVYLSLHHGSRYQGTPFLIVWSVICQLTSFHLLLYVFISISATLGLYFFCRSLYILFHCNWVNLFKVVILLKSGVDIILAISSIFKLQRSLLAFFLELPLNNWYLFLAVGFFTTLSVQVTKGQFAAFTRWHKFAKLAPTWHVRRKKQKMHWTKFLFSLNHRKRWKIAAIRQKMENWRRRREAIDVVGKPREVV